MSEEIQEIEIEKIKRTDKFYPRSRVNLEVVELYKESLDKLPPIELLQIDNDFEVISGAHRLRAFRESGHKTVKAIVFTNLSDKERWKKSVEENSRHGLLYKGIDRNNIAIESHKMGFSEQEITNMLSVDLRVVSEKYLAEIKREKKKERNQEILALWLNASLSTRDIAEKLGIDNQTVKNIIDKTVEKTTLMENSTLPEYPKEHKLTSVWNFSACDKEYGTDKYPGRMPGQIVENLLYNYTEIGEIVLDPFAGGGTTIDVCKKWKRRFIAYDISEDPIRSEIITNDATIDIPLPKSLLNHPKNIRPKFILIDPPYADQKRGDYTQEENDLSNLSLHNFYDAINNVAINSYNILEKNGYLAFIISNKKEKSKVYDLVHLCKQKFYNAGFEFENEFVVEYAGNQALTGAYMKYAKKPKGTLVHHRILTIFKK